MDTQRRSPEEIFLLQMFRDGFALSGCHPLDLVQCLLNDTDYYKDLLKDTESGRRWSAQERRRRAYLFRKSVAGLLDLYVAKGRGYDA